MTVTAQDIDHCIRTLEGLVADRGGLAQVDPERRVRLLTAAGRVSRPERTEQRLLSRALRKLARKEQRDKVERVLDRSPIRRLRAEAVFMTPPPRQLGGGSGSGEGIPSEASPTGAAGAEVDADQCCYVCKKLYRKLHHFYDQLCVPCGDISFAKRSQVADLRGRVACISGARVKIGYQAAILLLRSGARVIVSTRFPRDATERYAAEADFEDWRDRLVIYGLDLRHTPSVEAFTQHLSNTEDRLDFIIHNACQTVRRPLGFYQHLMDRELAPVTQLSERAQRLLAGRDGLRETARSRGITLREGGRIPNREAAPGMYAAAALSQAVLTAEDRDAGAELFPTGHLDADLQQVDHREMNSWRLGLDQVGTVELLEVQLVNAIAPFVMNARLKPLMLRQPASDRHIVNVSAMEGQFYRRFKTDKHPHTNMAKAALNMMTRTSAADYIKDGIHMNSVDTGWVTDEDPVQIARRKAEQGFNPPLDIVDGAARIVDPILSGVRTGNHVWGKFLKDFLPTDW